MSSSGGGDDDRISVLGSSDDEFLTSSTSSGIPQSNSLMERRRRIASPATLSEHVQFTSDVIRSVYLDYCEIFYVLKRIMEGEAYRIFTGDKSGYRLETLDDRYVKRALEISFPDIPTTDNIIDQRRISSTIAVNILVNRLYLMNTTVKPLHAYFETWRPSVTDLNKLTQTIKDLKQQAVKENEEGVQTLNRNDLNDLDDALYEINAINKLFKNEEIYRRLRFIIPKSIKDVTSTEFIKMLQTIINDTTNATKHAENTIERYVNDTQDNFRFFVDPSSKYPSEEGLVLRYGNELDYAKWNGIIEEHLVDTIKNRKKLTEQFIPKKHVKSNTSKRQLLKASASSSSTTDEEDDVIFTGEQRSVAGDDVEFAGEQRSVTGEQRSIVVGGERISKARQQSVKPRTKRMTLPPVPPFRNDLTGGANVGQEVIESTNVSRKVSKYGKRASATANSGTEQFPNIYDDIRRQVGFDKLTAGEIGAITEIRREMFRSVGAFDKRREDIAQLAEGGAKKIAKRKYDEVLLEEEPSRVYDAITEWLNIDTDNRKTNLLSKLVNARIAEPRELADGPSSTSDKTIASSRKIPVGKFTDDEIKAIEAMDNTADTLESPLTYPKGTSGYTGLIGTTSAARPLASSSTARKPIVRDRVDSDTISVDLELLGSNRLNIGDRRTTQDLLLPVGNQSVVGSITGSILSGFMDSASVVGRDPNQSRAASVKGRNVQSDNTSVKSGSSQSVVTRLARISSNVADMPNTPTQSSADDDDLFVQMFSDEATKVANQPKASAKVPHDLTNQPKTPIEVQRELGQKRTERSPPSATNLQSSSSGAEQVSSSVASKQPSPKKMPSPLKQPSPPKSALSLPKQSSPMKQPSPKKMPSPSKSPILSIAALSASTTNLNLDLSGSGEETKTDNTTSMGTQQSSSGFLNAPIDTQQSSSVSMNIQRSNVPMFPKIPSKSSNVNLFPTISQVVNEPLQVVGLTSGGAQSSSTSSSGQQASSSSSGQSSSSSSSGKQSLLASMLPPSIRPVTVPIPPAITSQRVAKKQNDDDDFDVSTSSCMKCGKIYRN